MLQNVFTFGEQDSPTPFFFIHKRAAHSPPGQAASDRYRHVRCARFGPKMCAGAHAHTPFFIPDPHPNSFTQTSLSPPPSPCTGQGVGVRVGRVGEGIRVQFKVSWGRPLSLRYKLREKTRSCLPVKMCQYVEHWTAQLSYLSIFSRETKERR